MVRRTPSSRAGAPLSGVVDVLPQRSMGRTVLRGAPRRSNPLVGFSPNFLGQQNQANMQSTEEEQNKPSGFLGALGALSPLLSGEEFINLLPGDMGTDIRNKLEEVPTIGGFLGAAFDVGTSPLTILTGGMGGAIGASAGGLARFGLAGRAAAGTTKALTAPLIMKGNPLQRIAGETAVLASAQEGTEALGLPAWTQLAGVGIGLKGLGAAQKTGVGKTLFGEPGSGIGTKAEQLTEDIVKRGGGVDELIKRSNEKLQYPEQQLTVKFVDADDLANKTTVAELGINAPKGSYLKGVRSMLEGLAVQGESLRSGTRGRANSAARVINEYAKETNKIGNRVFANKDGIIIKDRIDPTKPAFLGDVLEKLDKDIAYTKEVFDQVDEKLYPELLKLKTTYDELAMERTAHGISIRDPIDEKALDINFIPRYAKYSDIDEYVSKGIKSSRKFLELKAEHRRKYKTFREGAENQLYEDPIEALTHYSADAVRDVVDQEIGNALRQFAGRGDAVLDRGTRTSIMQAVDEAVAIQKYKHKGLPKVKARIFDDLSAADQAKFLFENPHFKNFVKVGGESVTFEKKVADEIAEAFKKQEPNIIQRLAERVNVINRIVVPLRSTWDMSAGLVTNASVLYQTGKRSQKGAFVRNMFSAIADMNFYKDKGRNRVDDFLDSPEVRGGKKGDTEYIGAGKYVTIVNPDEPFAMKEFMPVLSTAGRNLVNQSFAQVGKKKAQGVLDTFNRNFAMIGNRNRMTLFYDAQEVYEASIRRGLEAKKIELGKVAGNELEIADVNKLLSSKSVLDDTALREIGRAVDRATGIGTMKAGQVERALLFAPNFYRSMIETIGQLASEGSIEGDLARKYIANMVEGGVFLTAGVAMAQGRDPQEVLSLIDGKALEDGDLRLNPNFGTMRIGNRDVNVWGPYDSLLRLSSGVAKVAYSTGQGDGLDALQDYIVYATRTKGSPAASYLMNMKQGETFTGRDFSTVEGQLQQFVPFSMSTAFEEGADKYAATNDIVEGLKAGGLGMGLSALGAKENPVTPFEQLDRAARDKDEFGNRPYSELTRQERAVIDEENPEVVAMYEASRRFDTSPEGKMAKFRTEELAKLKDMQQQAFDQLQATGDRYTFRKTMDSLAARQAEAARTAESIFGVEYDSPEAGTPEAVVPFYYEILKNARNPLTNQLDWDAVDSGIAKLEEDVKNGLFGNPDRAQEFLDERVIFRGNPNVEWYYANKNVIQEITMKGFNYWDQKDRAFLELQGTVVRAAGRNISTYNGLLEEIKEAALNNDKVRANRLGRILNRIDRKTDRYRKAMRRFSPDVEKALMENGYLS